MSNIDIATVGLNFTNLPILATLGDSRLAQGFTAAGNFQNSIPLGANWLPALMAQRVKLPYANSFAVSGAKYADIIATQLPLLVAAQAAGAGITHCVVLCGTNDFNVTAQATIKTQAAAVWTALRNLNIKPVHVIDLPRMVASWTSTHMKLRDEFNQWLRDYAGINGVALIDPFAQIADPANANGDPLSGYYQSDGIHPAPLTGYQVGLALKRYFDSVPLPYFSRPSSRGDLYDAANNVRGNLLVDAGLFAGGTGGTSNGTGASGTVATGWQNRVISGTMTAVGSIVARTDEGAVGNWQQTTITVTTAGVHRLELDAGLTGFAAGDVLVGEVDVKVASAVKLLYAQLNTFDADGTGATVKGSIAFKNPGLAGLYMPSDYQVRLRTEPFTLGTGITNLPFRLEAGFENGGSAVISYGAASLRKVVAQ